ncbi:hypothetical protein RF11_06824 [Thelohanellus kitauei]|uniref:Uncharacterized protein n=1 Tax=Thelohanellus kitauei TaxID=669202 RepID=A0A0C2N385_THEKT|nr:hypothetical protein RF11_06824 [Thelohanellus kitauei]
MEDLTENNSNPLKIWSFNGGQRPNGIPLAGYHLGAQDVFCFPSKISYWDITLILLSKGFDFSVGKEKITAMCPVYGEEGTLLLPRIRQMIKTENTGKCNRNIISISTDEMLVFSWVNMLEKDEASISFQQNLFKVLLFLSQEKEGILLDIHILASTS